MKKALMLFGALCVVVSAIGCGSKEDALMDDMDSYIMGKIDDGKIKNNADLSKAMQDFEKENKDKFEELKKENKDQSDEDKKKAKERFEKLFEKWQKAIKDKNK